MEQKVQEKIARHQYKQKMDLLHPVSEIGATLVKTVEQRVDESDDYYGAGMQKMKKYAMPAMDVVAVAGARELSKGMRAELDQITLTGGRVCEMLHEGSLSMVDLADEKLLKKRLEQIEGIRAFQKKQICRFRETAYDMMMVKDSLEKRSNVMDKLEEPLKKHLKSEDFFDLKQKKTNELLKIYFKNSRNDVLRSVNPAGMNEKQLKELIKTQDKNDFSIVDMSALRLVARQMKYREIRIKAGRILNIRKRIQTMHSFVRNMDTTAGEGIRQVDNIVQVSNAAFELGKFGLKAGVVSASFVGKYTGAVYLAGMASQKSREQTELVKQKVEKAVKESKAYRAVNGKIEDLKAGADKVKASVGRKIEHNSGTRKYKQVQGGIGKKSKTVAQKVGRARAAAKSAGRNVRQGTDMVLSPLRMTGNIFGRVKGAFGKARLMFLAGVGIVVVVFLLVIILINAILSACGTQSNAALTAILTNDDGFVADMAGNLKVKADEKRQEAVHIAEGIPQNADVLEGHKISRYGHVNRRGILDKGYRIYYVDERGNRILDGKNNIRDCIVMAYVIMGGDFDTNTAARDELIYDLWEMMNPEMEYQESAIYTCPYGCDVFAYHCNVAEDYAVIGQYQSDGVGFYGSIPVYSEYGDKYTLICNGCYDGDGHLFYHPVQMGRGVGEPDEGCADYSVTYECRGHYNRVCYGHKDIEIYLTVISMQEMFETGRLPDTDGKSYKAYVDAFEGWTEDNREWVMLLVGGDWSELYSVLI